MDTPGSQSKGKPGSEHTAGPEPSEQEETVGRNLLIGYGEKIHSSNLLQTCVDRRVNGLNIEIKNKNQTNNNKNSSCMDSTGG